MTRLGLFGSRASLVGVREKLSLSSSVVRESKVCDMRSLNRRQVDWEEVLYLWKQFGYKMSNIGVYIPHLMILIYPLFLCLFNHSANADLCERNTACGNTCSSFKQNNGLGKFPKH